MTCKICNALIDDEDYERKINAETDNEFVVCKSCFDSMWENDEITKCVSCGEWYQMEMLVSDLDVPEFTPCPSCGNDIVEGYDREEAIINAINRLSFEADMIKRDIGRLEMIHMKEIMKRSKSNDDSKN